MSQPIIAYGAGKYGRIYLPELKKCGLEPVCFVDQDPQKINTRYCGYDVMSLSEAESLTDTKLDIYLTLSSIHLLAATEYLLQQGIEKKRIKYLEDVEYRNGCHLLNTWLIYDRATGMHPCWHWKYNEEDRVAASGAPSVDYAAYTKKVDQLIDDLRNNRDCTCVGCPNLKYGIYPKRFIPRTLALPNAVKGEWCNARCIYCDLTNLHDGVYMDGFDAMKVLDGFVPYFGENSFIYYVPAEITVSPIKTQLYNFMQEHNWNFTVIKTNGIKYDRQLADFCSKGTKVNVSLDSGTKETYEKVKGINAFDKVIENIKKYRDDGATIELKYILLENVNDSENDMDGFLSLAKELADKLVITVDMHTSLREGISPSLWKKLEIFAEKIVASQIPVSLHPEHLSNESLERLSKLLCLT